MKNNSGHVVAIPAWFLLATIFITGNVVMMLEVVGTRVVGPFFGVGIYVWSALITVTLLALSAGYWLGGKLADAKHRPEFLFLAILISSILVFVIPLWRNPVLTFASQFGVRTGVMVGSTLLFGAPLFLLGIVSPYAAKLYADQFEKLGSRVGLLYAISTLGSFLGTLTMGFYLIPNFRLTVILVSLGFALLLLPLVYFFLIRTNKAAMFSLLVALCAGIAAMYPHAPDIQRISENVQIIYKATSFYGEIKVMEIGGKKRVLLVDGVTQSGENFQTHQEAPPYVQDMSNLIGRYNPTAKKVLVMGLGGGNIVHAMLAKGLSVDVVEIDKKIVSVATTYFGIDPKKVTISLDDGRRFVRHCSTKYDVVVMNTFNGESSPSHMLAREFFQEIKPILNPDGIVALNFVGYVEGPHRFGSAAVYATLRAAYAWCDTYFREPKNQFSNVVFIAGDGVIPPEPQAEPVWQELKTLAVTIPGGSAAVVCTDEYNPIDFLNRVVYRRWRQLVIDSVGPNILLN